MVYFTSTINTFHTITQSNSIPIRYFNLSKHTSSKTNKSNNINDITFGGNNS